MRHVLIICLPILATAAFGQAPCQQNHVHQAGQIAMNLSSSAILGNEWPYPGSNAWDLPCRPGVLAPQLEYPAGSGVQYMYQGCLWVGALLEEEDGSLTPRVSTGQEGWNGDVTEFWPSPSCEEGFHEGSRNLQAMDCTGTSTYDPAALADQEFTFWTADTLANYPEVITGAIFDPEDRDHRPLGIEIRQQSRQWGVEPDYDSFILLHYQIRNMGGELLHSPYVGLYMNGDVMELGDADEFGNRDDLTMLRSHARHEDGQDSILVNAMLFFDNDGRRRNDVSGADLRCPAVLAVMPLGIGDQQLSFNHWRSHASLEQDYGPSWAWWQDHPEFGNAWTDTLGTPMADAHKYQLMGNGEIDPPWFTQHTGGYPPQPILDENGSVVEWRSWLEPGEFEQPEWLGDEVLGLLSIGPLGTEDGVDSLGRPRTVFQPGDQVDVWFALVMGDSLHRSCCLQPDIGNTVDPSLFYFADLDRRLILVKEAFEQGFPELPMPPVLSWEVPAQNQVRLSWTSQTGHPDLRYRLVRRHLQSGQETVLADNSQATEWWDTFAEGDSLLYCLQEVWPNEGLRSGTAEAQVAPDYPSAVTALQVTGGDARIELSWTAETPEVAVVHCVMPENHDRDEYCWPPLCPLETDTTWLEDTGSAVLTGQANLFRHFVKVHARAANGFLSAAEWHSVVPHSELRAWRVLSFVGPSWTEVDTAATRSNLQQLFAEADLDHEVHVAGSSPALDRSMLDGCRNLWINWDRPAGYPVFGRIRELDLLHFQEAGGGLIITNFILENAQIDIPLDPFNAGDLVTRPVPAEFTPTWEMSTLEVPWSLQVSDPALGSVFAADTGELEQLRIHQTAEGGDWIHAGHFVLPGNEELDGQIASMTFSNPGPVHLLKVPMYAVDMDASLDYFLNVLNATTDIETEPAPAPAAFSLRPCAPNPFNPVTRVSYELTQAGPVELSVFNLRGALVRTLVHEEQMAGSHTVIFDGSGLASGLYFLRLEAVGQVQTQKALLMK